MQHQKKLKDLSIGDLNVDNGEEEGDPNMDSNLLTVADTGNAAFLDELLRARFDPDIGDSEGRTPLVCFSVIYIYIYNRIFYVFVFYTFKNMYNSII